jgi:hypothetical protein
MVRWRYILVHGMSENEPEPVRRYSCSRGEWDISAREKKF